MYSDEKYFAIRSIAAKEFFDVKAHEETLDLEHRINSIIDRFPTIYTKLEKENLLPEHMTFESFQQTVVPHLQHAVHQYQIARMFMP
jgi:aspartate oxidase